MELREITVDEQIAYNGADDLASGPARICEFTPPAGPGWMVIVHRNDMSEKVIVNVLVENATRDDYEFEKPFYFTHEQDAIAFAEFLVSGKIQADGILNVCSNL